MGGRDEGGTEDKVTHPDRSASEPSGARERTAGKRPWAGRPDRADLACWAGLIVSGVYGVLLTPVRPLLIARHPMLLELLGGSMSAMVAAGAFARVEQTPVIFAVLAGVPGCMLFDPFYWWAGRRWGRTLLEMIAGPRAVLRGERAFRRYGPVAIVLGYFLPIPVTIIYAFAGSSGMRLRRFVLLDAAGTLLWAATLVGLGYGLGSGAVAVAKEVSHYGLVISLVLSAVVVGPALWRLRGAAARSATVSPRE